MATHVETLVKQLNAAEKQIKQLSLQLKKGRDPKVVKQIQELMVRFNKTNLTKLYVEAAQKDAAYMSDAFGKINPGL